MQQIKTISRQITLAIAALLCFSYCCFAQTQPGIPVAFGIYSQNTLQEKMFVHTDRDTYLTGELIWFKIYTADGIYNKPLNFSKVAYVEVLDDKQNAVIQAKITLDNGSGGGSVFIPVTVSNGNYRLRAYTSWMKNFSPAYYFEKTITIINPQRVPEATATTTAAMGIDIQFFPEGGNLVNGLKSKVAFKATGPDGMGVNFKGAIIDQKNDTLIRFSPLKFGMGHFLFTPATGNTYRAVISVANKKPLIKNLPDVKAEGYVIQLTDNGTGQLALRVSGNTNLTENLYVFAHTRQLIKVAKEINLNNGAARLLIDKSQLGEGISHITLFNSARQPVCERLYFKHPTTKLLIEANTDEQQYSTRKKVNITLGTKSQAGKPLNANLSMSIYRVDRAPDANQEDILSYLWLRSDLQGTIESPGYYFNENSAEAAEAIDNLMLTQGWRRFNWASVLTNKLPAFNFVPEIYGHIITAKIVNNATNKPADGIVAYLASPGKRVQLFTAKSDTGGMLLFNTSHLNGTEMVVMPDTMADSTYRIDILSPFSDQYSQAALPAFSVNSATADALETRNVEMQVQNIYARDRIKQFNQPIIDSPGFYNPPAATYLLDNYTRFTTMEEVLREYVKEVNLVRRQGKMHIKMLGEKSYLDDPLVLVDGIPVFDADKLMAVDPLTIRKLEVLPKKYYYGPASMEGILSFTSYKGNLAGMEIDPHAVVVDYEGLQLQRIFYSPVYDTGSQQESHLPDFRDLLYWSPSVSANGSVSFYTSDQAGDYIGIVQGISAGGEAGSGYFKLSVKN